MESNFTEELLQAAEMELVYKTKVKASLRPAITSSQEAYKIFHHSWDCGKIEQVEQMKVLCLNRRNKVLGIYTVSSGGVYGTVMDIRQVLAPAILANAVYFILAHNHPSGDLKPSKADKEITNRIKEAGQYLDIRLLDHLIITDEGYFSFADDGLL